MPPKQRLISLGHSKLCQDSLLSLPFLYQTQTIQRSGHKNASHTRSLQSRQQSCRRLTTSSRHSGEQRDSYAKSSSRPPPIRRHQQQHQYQRRQPTIDYASQADVLPSFNANSTLTPMEDQKFRRIFEAAARGLPPPSQQQQQQEADEELELRYQIGISLDQKFEKLAQRKSMPETKATNAVADGVADLATISGESELDNVELAAQMEQGSSEETQRAELRDLQRRQRAERAEKRRGSSLHFPEALRAAWRDVQRSTSQFSSASKKKAKKKNVSPSQLMDLSESEVNEIQWIHDLYSNARSDRELWSVLQDKVFSRIPKLVYTIDLFKQKKSAARKKREASKSEASVSHVGANDTTPVAVPTEMAVDLVQKLSLKEVSIVQNTYSAHLVNAVRILRSQFPRSPFIAALLPAVKKLSPISQVLGANTALYNELLYTAWRQSDDVAECARLVEDMYAQGLEADEYTLAVFADAQTEMSAALADRQSVRPSRRLWWRLQGVQNSMTRWHAAMDLLSIRAENDEIAEKEWEMMEDRPNAIPVRE